MVALARGVALFRANVPDYFFIAVSNNHLDLSVLIRHIN